MGLHQGGCGEVGASCTSCHLLPGALSHPRPLHGRRIAGSTSEEHLPASERCPPSCSCAHEAAPRQDKEGKSLGELLRHQLPVYVGSGGVQHCPLVWSTWPSGRLRQR